MKYEIWDNTLQVGLKCNYCDKIMYRGHEEKLLIFIVNDLPHVQLGRADREDRDGYIKGHYCSLDCLISLIIFGIISIMIYKYPVYKEHIQKVVDEI